MSSREDDPRYNAAEDLIERNLAAGRADRIAVIGEGGKTTYGQLADKINRCASGLLDLGLEMEQRVALCLLDTVDFPTAFLGAIKAGIVPVPINTLLTTEDYRYMLNDSRARCLIVSEALLPKFLPLMDSLPHLKHVVVSGAQATDFLAFDDLLASGAPEFAAAPTSADDICFWLYSSGSTGRPKGAVHLQSHLIRTAELYAHPVLEIDESDVVFSAAKLFFAYGLGNGLTFPFSVGATAILYSGRPTSEAVSAILKDERPTLFFGVPTLYSMLLAGSDLPVAEDLNLRLCVSAGEALPAELFKRWLERTGCEILDGIGSTEMLHIFLSNRAGQVRPGTSGREIPGYGLRIVGDDGLEVPKGELGELQVDGPTSAVMYWNKRERSRQTFLGTWTRTGDKYIENEDGTFTYCGRSDDMLKVGGIYVSPFEVEEALISHESVLEAAVIGKADQDELIKPKAFIVPQPGVTADAVLEKTLTNFTAEKLAPYKRPRWVEFVEALPKTATGKIQRFKLRDRESAR